MIHGFIGGAFFFFFVGWGGILYICFRYSASFFLKKKFIYIYIYIFFFLGGTFQGYSYFDPSKNIHGAIAYRYNR